MSAQGTIEQKEQLRFGCIWLIGFFAMATAALAQYPAQYPSQSQVPKDGTAVLLEDYATLPASSPTHGGANNRSVDFKGQLGRVTSMRSEPSNAPLAASRFFVNDQSGTLYVLDKQQTVHRLSEFSSNLSQVCVGHREYGRDRFDRV